MKYKPHLKYGYKTREAWLAAEWELAKARTANDYGDESRRKSFYQLCADSLGKPFNEVTGDEIDAWCDEHEETVEIPFEFEKRIDND